MYLKPCRRSLFLSHRLPQQLLKELLQLQLLQKELFCQQSINKTRLFSINLRLSSSTDNSLSNSIPIYRILGAKEEPLGGGRPTTGIG